MHIPRFWRRFEGEVRKPDGARLRLFAWGWSESSERDADANARERFQNIEHRVWQGLDLPKGYGYGSRPVREQILREIEGRRGDVEALLTRNAYGSVVLNAARTMFIDVDAPQADAGALGRLFRGRQDDMSLDQVRKAVASAGIGTVRLYRTAAGFRLLATDRVFTPGSSEAESAMRAVGADPAFVQLCKVQDSFRARLTPKPWRVGQKPPPGDFPREEGAEQQAFEEWLEKYEHAAASKATCRFIETIGSGWVDSDVARILALHDEQTRAGSDLPLA